MAGGGERAPVAAREGLAVEGVVDGEADPGSSKGATRVLRKK
jgi:hypothetical protein